MNKMQKETAKLRESVYELHKKLPTTKHLEFYNLYGRLREIKSQKLPSAYNYLIGILT